MVSVRSADALTSTSLIHSGFLEEDPSTWHKLGRGDKNIWHLAAIVGRIDVWYVGVGAVHNLLRRARTNVATGSRTRGRVRPELPAPLVPTPSRRYVRRYVRIPTAHPMPLPATQPPAQRVGPQGRAHFNGGRHRPHGAESGEWRAFSREPGRT